MTRYVPAPSASITLVFSLRLMGYLFSLNGTRSLRRSSLNARDGEHGLQGAVPKSGCSVTFQFLALDLEVVRLVREFG